MAKLRFHYRDDQIQTRLRSLDARLAIAVDALMDYYALKGMGYLKTDAPWTDRTGAARTGLHTSVGGYSRGADGRFMSGSNNQRVITFAHSVNYGIWLEVKYSGRDAVIMPTVLKTGGELMQALQSIMRQM